MNLNQLKKEVASIKQQVKPENAAVIVEPDSKLIINGKKVSGKEYLSVEGFKKYENIPPDDIQLLLPNGKRITASNIILDDFTERLR